MHASGPWKLSKHKTVSVMFRSAFIKISWVASYSDWALNWTWRLISEIKHKQVSGK